MTGVCLLTAPADDVDCWRIALNALFWMLYVVFPAVILLSWISQGISGRRASIGRKERLRRAKSFARIALWQVPFFLLLLAASVTLRSPDAKAIVMYVTFAIGPVVAAIIVLWPERQRLPKPMPGDEPCRSAVCVVAIENDYLCGQSLYCDGFFVTGDLFVAPLTVLNPLGRWGLHVQGGTSSFELVSVDMFYNLALLKAVDPLPPHEVLPLAANSAHLLPGNQLVCIGYSASASQTSHWQSQRGEIVWQGPISLFEDLDAPSDDPRWNDPYRFILVSLPGHPGSPVVDLEGKVVGVLVGEHRAADNSAIVTPVEAIHELMTRAERKGSI
jgi:hypothetical protein